MLLPQKIKLKWTNQFKSHYESLGYTFTKRGDEFEVDIIHLQNGSNKNVKVKCDYCGDINLVLYNNYNKSKKTGMDCCKNCINKKISIKRKIPNKGNSLGEKYPNLILYWSDKNTKTPFDYNYGSNEKVWWKCQKGHESFSQFPIKGRFKCPKCKEPLGEKAIREYLAKNKIEYIQQYSFPDLLSENSYPLKFDFAIFKDGKLKTLIEYDGRQHFIPIFGEEQLNITKYRDNLKNKYCELNHINLIRIDYNNYENIEQMLNKKI